PDVILMFMSDHFVSFFLDNMPTFCIGTFQHADGPHELSRSMPFYRITGHPEFATGLVEYGIDSGFDLACSQDMKLDHATLVPLHFLTPDMTIPVVPFTSRFCLSHYRAPTAATLWARWSDGSSTSGRRTNASPSSPAAASRSRWAARGWGPSTRNGTSSWS